MEDVFGGQDMTSAIQLDMHKLEFVKGINGLYNPMNSYSIQ